MFALPAPNGGSRFAPTGLPILTARVRFSLPPSANIVQTFLCFCNYRNYYRQLARQASKDLFRLGASQMIGAVIAIAIFAFQYFYGMIPEDHTLLAFESLAWPYLILIITLFLFSAIRAPALLDAEAQNKIRDLAESLASPDKQLEDHLRECLSRIGDGAKKVIQFILWHGETSVWRIKITGMTEDDIRESVQQCLTENLLVPRYERQEWHKRGDKYTIMDSIRPSIAYYSIPGAFHGILQRLISGIAIPPTTP
jgi:hypothetical protein